ncbi:MAG: hypothetical protein J6C37_09140 [Roseburia sp.]|nr:hypothetical protein [Roseburia sp.]
MSEIASMLEEEETVIQKICDAAKKYAPDYDAKKIYADMKESEKNSKL